MDSNHRELLCAIERMARAIKDIPDNKPKVLMPAQIWLMWRAVLKEADLEHYFFGEDKD